MNRRLFSILSALSLLLFVACIVAWISHGRRAEVVHYVLPPGYRGYFWIIVDRARGTKVEVKNRQATLRMPPDGVLYVDDDRFFHGWHKVTASDYSGTRIAGGTDDVYDPGTIMVTALNVSQESGPTHERIVYYHLVGTADDVNRHNKSDRSLAREQLDQRLAGMRSQEDGSTAK